MTSEVRHNVFLALKEALHNVVKHAAATEVRVSLRALAGGFCLVLADNGRGFELGVVGGIRSPSEDSARLSAGNGLLNMRKRLEEIGGRCEWSTAPGKVIRVPTRHQNR